MASSAEAPVPGWESAAIARAAAGDRAAFGTIYQAYAGAIYHRVLYPLLGNGAAAEDALAETFRSAYQALGDYQQREASVYHWLARIARNKAYDMHRARAVTRRALSNFTDLMGPLASEAVASPEHLLGDHHEQHDLKQRVREILGHIHARYRRAIELRFIEERSREECAQALEVTISTFDVVLLRALRAFRKEWTVRVKGVDDERATAQ